ncbi:UDP-N-acetylglucosamine 2-epimerase [Roseibium denhamense]|uniref:UDP-N-acetylglucosamine 2-epimerase (Non-hydrolysing)/GDP/UDP-N,N'-diacetylbacillosamine 2-epimerase (Hydrolysing) n=2 Tax=Roseibium denhamense TaxID=76305 RepID=A0ABY1PP23_9HYPH|nr:UDP-N-acetylglucosamine 2-epimerase [Roseibium denhamense]SMP37170.1 UDP-N-acetylglucosamine 2-epimerase (non-hydrolysing)/GDP/UDP-N,N'-diacetylbacillosamine 2-epimerase (hydrolysing) [Roseibium denhamense]
MSKRVFFLTGIRSEYDILAPVIDAVDRTDGLETSVIVTGAHLIEKFGHSVQQIEADGRDIVTRIRSLPETDSLSSRVHGAATQIAGMADLFAEKRPDFLVVMGDREESITGALSAVYHNIPVVHIGGGDHAEDGNVDNPIRHAVSKLSHLHMVTTELSGQRLERIGEENWRINVVGASGIDRLLSTQHMSREQLEQEINVGWEGKPYVVVLYHPTISDFEEARIHMRTICDILETSGLNVVIMAPNSDPGNFAIVSEIEALVERCDRVRSFKFLPRKTFVNLLRHAHAMVGNSSAGIIEAPSLGLPAINIGVRQRGREHAENVIFTSYEAPEISEALRKAIFDQGFRERVALKRSPYGDGTAGERIAKVIRETVPGPELMHKKFVM